MPKRSFTNGNVFNGTHAYVLWNGEPIMETSKFSAKIKPKREAMLFCNEMTEDSKLMSISCEYSMTVKKVYSRAFEIAKNLVKGKDPRLTISNCMCDPEAIGEERIELYNCWFNDLDLASWETGKISEQEFSGGFTDFDFPDEVTPPTK